MEFHSLTDAEVQHGGMRAHLTEESEASDNLVIQLDEVIFGQGVNIDMPHNICLSVGAHIVPETRNGLPGSQKPKKGTPQPAGVLSPLAVQVIERTYQSDAKPPGLASSCTDRRARPLLLALEVASMQTSTAV
jgi:hypothetical protein